MKNEDMYTTNFIHTYMWVPGTHVQDQEKQVHFILYLVVLL